MKLAFYLGAAAFLGAVLWRPFSTREYSPAELAEFEERVDDQAGGVERHARTSGWYRKSAAVWIVVGAAFAGAVALFCGHSINALALGGLLLVLAGLATLRVDDHEDRD